MIYKHKISGEYLELIRKGDLSVNTYRVVDIEGNPILGKPNWKSSVGPEEIHRIITGYKDLEQVQLKLF